MREITALFYQMFGTSISPGTISTLIEALDAECDAFQTRALTNDYAFLVLDAMYVRCMVAPAAKLKGAKDGESVQKVAVLLVRGIKHDGTRELIDFRLAAGEREAAWEAFLLSLYQRGLEAHDTMVPREHRKWITTTNPIERYVRELRRRTRPMNTFQSLESCRRLIYAAIKKLSDERRNDIPFSLWPSQPYYGSRSRKQPPKPKPDLDMLRKDFFNDLIDWTRI